MSTTTPRTCGELSCEECNARTAALMAERDQLRVDLELADVMYQRECEVEHELRTEVERLRAEVERLKTCGIAELAAVNSSVLEYCKHWEARAERAEGNLAALEQSFDDNCRGVVKIAADLAAERARLDYLLQWDVTFHDRADIDAELSYGQRKKSTPTLP